MCDSQDYEVSNCDRDHLFNQTTIRDRKAYALVMSIIKIIGIKQFTLAVYYTSSDCYKYSIIDDYGTVLEPDSIFYTSD